MADNNFSQDPFDELAGKVGVLWNSARQDYEQAKPAERLTALGGFATAILNLGLLLVGIVAGIIYFFQLEATRSQLAVMQEQLESADRPWLKITGAMPSAPMMFHIPWNNRIPGNDYVNAGIKVVVQNVGHSVALDVVTRSNMLVVSMAQGAQNSEMTSPFQDSYPFKMQKALCSEPVIPGLTMNLFPGDDNSDQTGGDQDDPLAGKTFTIPGDPTQKLLVLFVGCADYRISVSGKMHHSNFIYELMGVDPTQRNAHGLFTVGTDIPITDLRMEKWAWGGFDAN